MLTIEVKRHDQGEDYFEPWIEKFDDGKGWRFHFHWDDISDEGVETFREVYPRAFSVHVPRSNPWRRRISWMPGMQPA